MGWGGVGKAAPQPFRTQVSDTGSAGELVRALSDQVVSVQAALLELEHKVQSQQLHPRAAGMKNNGGFGAPEVSHLVAADRLLSLEQTVKELKNQAQRTGVTINGFTFESPEDVKTWMAKYGVENLTYLFVDPLSLLALSDLVSATEDAGTAARVMSAKINKSPEMTKYPQSWASEITCLPSQRTRNWQRYQNTPTGTPARVQTACRIMMRLLWMGETSCSYAIDQTLADQPHTLATKMLALLLSHWERVSSWMTLYHSEIGVRSHATKEECWLLVTSCVRTILLEAHMARLPGRAVHRTTCSGEHSKHTRFCLTHFGKDSGAPKGGGDSSGPRGGSLDPNRFISDAGKASHGSRAGGEHGEGYGGPSRSQGQEQSVGHSLTAGGQAVARGGRRGLKWKR